MRGERRVAVRDFHTGYKKMQLASDELIRAICVPRRFAGYVRTREKSGRAMRRRFRSIAIAALARVEQGIGRTFGSRWEASRPCRCGWRKRSGCLTDKSLDASLIELAGNDGGGRSPADR